MTTSDSIERHPWGYPWPERFPDATRVEAFEGGAVFAAEADGAWWVITDEGTLADFLDDEDDAGILSQLIRVERSSRSSLARHDRERPSRRRSGTR